MKWHIEVWTAPWLHKGWLLPDQASPHSDPVDPTSVPPHHHKTHHEVVRRGLHSQLTWPRTSWVPEAAEEPREVWKQARQKISDVPSPFPLLFQLFLTIRGTKPGHPRRAGCGCSLKRSVRSLCGEQDSGRPKLMAKSSLCTAWVGSKLNSRIYLHFIHSI